MQGTCYSIEVKPTIPTAIGQLIELAGNLFYSWSTDVRALYYDLQETGPSGSLAVSETCYFEPQGSAGGKEAIYRPDLQPRLAGLQYYMLRMYPYHLLRTQRFEMGYMEWH